MNWEFIRATILLQIAAIFVALVVHGLGWWSRRDSLLVALTGLLGFFIVQLPCLIIPSLEIVVLGAAVFLSFLHHQQFKLAFSDAMAGCYCEAGLLTLGGGTLSLLMNGLISWNRLNYESAELLGKIGLLTLISVWLLTASLRPSFLQLRLWFKGRRQNLLRTTKNERFSRVARTFPNRHCRAICGVVFGARRARAELVGAAARTF